MSRALLGTALPIAALLAAMAAPAHAQVDRVAGLSQRLGAVEADPALSGLAAYERLQARQALERLVEAGSREREGAMYVAERRVAIAEVAARTQAMQREIDRLDRERSELLVEASRQDAARARAEAERLRIRAQIQAEEATRMREQAQADSLAMQDVEAALQGVAGAQSARLSAAREREAELARQEAVLMAGGSLPPASRDARGEVFTLAGDAFASGQATLTGAAVTSVRTLAAYLQADPRATVQVEGHTDSQGDAAANRALSQRRADAVRDALVAAGVPRSQITAQGMGAERAVDDNATAAGRAANRRVEVVVAAN